MQEIYKHRYPKLKKHMYNNEEKQNSRGGRRAKRAGPLDALLSSGARSAPELRPASGSRGAQTRLPPDMKVLAPEYGTGIFKKMPLAPGSLGKCSYYKSGVYCYVFLRWAPGTISEKVSTEARKVSTVRSDRLNTPESCYKKSPIRAESLDFGRPF